MEFAVRQQPLFGGARSHATSEHRCPQCREDALVLQRRHVSPPQFGPTTVTEYYDCDYCDARFQYSPASHRWRPIYQ
jgi:C4-type Zn-finger protein